MPWEHPKRGMGLCTRLEAASWCCKGLTGTVCRSAWGLGWDFLPSEQETEILQLSLRALGPEAAQLAQVVGLRNTDQAPVGFPISEICQQHTASLHPTTPVAFTPPDYRSPLTAKTAHRAHRTSPPWVHDPRKCHLALSMTWSEHQTHGDESSHPDAIRQLVPIGFSDEG